jgi:hypothetical protein
MVIQKILRKEVPTCKQKVQLILRPEGIILLDYRALQDVWKEI